MNRLYIFTLPFCKLCKALEYQLEIESIPFTNIMVPDNKELWNSVKKQTGSGNCPTIFIQEDNDGSGYVYVPQKDFQTINDAMVIIREKITK